jgi:hypothetical protein
MLNCKNESHAIVAVNTVFWDVMSSNLVDINQQFRCSNRHFAKFQKNLLLPSSVYPEDGGNRFL